jgi:hypothetical protein
MNTVSPRCRRPVRAKEQGGIPVLEDPVCGRPEGHHGRCRSEAAVARKYRADNVRLAGVRRATGRQYGRVWWQPAGMSRLAAPAVPERGRAA